MIWFLTVEWEWSIFRYSPQRFHGRSLRCGPPARSTVGAKTQGKHFASRQEKVWPQFLSAKAQFDQLADSGATLCATDWASGMEGLSGRNDGFVQAGSAGETHLSRQHTSCSSIAQSCGLSAWRSPTSPPTPPPFDIFGRFVPKIMAQTSAEPGFVGDRNAATLVKNANPTRVTLVGRTERASSAPENLALARQRANAVPGAMIASTRETGGRETITLPASTTNA